MLGLEDKVMLVTGGSRGIGAATVALLEQLGAKVAYNDRSGLEQRGSLALQFDVTDAKGMEEVVQRTEQELGPI
ncbi:MAG TPA: SDR family NAD(P)-dependent oxidoreductase, partial [Candidatus Acidoferrales bacterium]|nr:SDR family NAD(P)-dependent oxidoreductase [Candidatus Acidoferrales bacterium]